MKNYKIPGGLSQTLHEAGTDEVFEVKAFMGKGLGLTKFGTHVAFVGGTGVLGFMDLVALLIKVDLGLVDPASIPIFGKGSTFKFVLYASFASRADAIALDLLEGLHEISKAKKLGNFELVLRLSNESKQRWDDTYIEN